MSCSTTKPTDWPVPQQRLRSVWVSAQSDQSLRCPLEEPLVHSWPVTAQRRLIRLGVCPGWSECSLGAHVILLVLSCSGSYINILLCFCILWLLPKLYFCCFLIFCLFEISRPSVCFMLQSTFITTDPSPGVGCVGWWGKCAGQLLCSIAG